MLRTSSLLNQRRRLIQLTAHCTKTANVIHHHHQHRYTPSTFVNHHQSFHTSPIQQLQQQTQPQQQQQSSSLLVRKAKAYYRLARLDKPIGTWLLLFPCLWSLSFADIFSSIPDPILMASFIGGAILMRGAGCTVNDLWDRDIDSKVERTKDRPLASKELSVPEALTFLGVQVAGAATILLTQFNPETIVACTASLALVGIYPLMKRVTNWPQFVLGLTFNWGALVGYLAISGYEFYNPYITIPLYLAGIAWTLVYDTIYAHQDKVDDRSVGVKSTALYFGDGTRGRTILFVFALLFGFFMTIAGYYGANYDLERQASYYLAVLMATIHLAHQATSANFANPADCMRKFKSNKYVGLLILAGIILANFGKQQDAARIMKKKRELLEIGVRREEIAENEDIERAKAMYQKNKEDSNMTVVEKIKSIFHMIGF
jgi:4-hydroxybenzoate polyprenyltransferase